MGQSPSGRRAALEGLTRILDAGSPEELFTTPEDEALFLYGLLVDVARARQSSYYWEVCRTARRRGVTPDYVVDRAVVLLTTMDERRRADLYRILGVPGLASGETIRQRWLELAKRHHPDAGGDGALFRRAREAYDVLGDPERRAEYERFWVRALGPFERVTPRDDAPLLDASGLRLPPRAVSAQDRTPAGVADAGAFAARAAALVGRIEGAALAALREDVARSVAALETVRDQLGTLAALKRALEG